MKNSQSPTASSQGDALSLIFARVESLGARLGFGLVVFTFGLYVSGLVAPTVPITTLNEFIGLNSTDFAQQTGSPVGWGWLAHLPSGDALSLSSLALLTSVIGWAFLAIIPHLIRTRDTLYLVFIVLQLGVFAVAAANLLGGVGH